MTTPGSKLIGLAGYARSGKDTAAAYLAAEYGYERRAFADKLRELAEAINPVVGFGQATYQWALDTLGYEQAKNIYPEVRDFLVALGKGVREVLGPDIWLDACLPPVRYAGLEVMHFGGPPLVVSDVRYPNEACRIRDLGGDVWLIDRLGIEPANDEEARSIQELIDEGYVTHRIYNDGTIDDLHRHVEAALAWR